MRDRRALRSAETSFGHFIGKFVAEFGDDGRKVTLMEPYSFVDPAGEEWNVPDGYKTDGASVPVRALGALPALHRQLPLGRRHPRLLLRHQEAQLAGHAQGLLLRHARRPCRRAHRQDHVRRGLSVRPALGPRHRDRASAARRSRPRRAAGESGEGAARAGRTRTIPISTVCWPRPSA